MSFDSESLSRAAVRFGRALAHVQRLFRHLSRLMPADQREIEVVMLEAGSPVSPLEHLFLAHELRRRGIPIVGLALPFARDWEVGADLPGDLGAFEATLRTHAAIARLLGPYKLGFHAGMAKERALPVVGRVCGELLHIKSTGASYLEALRVVCRRAPGLFGEIIEFARDHFATDRPAQGMATTPADIGRLMAAAVVGSMERVVFDTKAGRQLLEATWGSVVSLGRTARGRSFKEGILETLDAEPTLYRNLLDACFTRHLGLLNEG